MTTSGNAEIQPQGTPPEDPDELKRKLSEMESKVSTLENELNSLRKVKPQATRETWISRFILVIVLILAIIPPALVVADRWFYQIPGDWNSEMWCQVSFFCTSMFPPYFTVILACFFVLAILMLYLRRSAIVVVENPLTVFEKLEVGPGQKRISRHLLVASGLGIVAVIVWSQIVHRFPGYDLVLVWLLFLSGWFLRAVPLRMLAEAWKRDGEYWISLLLLHVAIVIVLAAYYDVNQIFFLSLPLLIFAFVNLWRFRKRVPILYWIISTALVLYAFNINAWWTAVIGDDYGFHDFAWAFAEKMSFAQIGNMLFQADGVFSTHPYFSSFIQGISIKLLGHDSFGWRFSSLYLCAIGIGLFYLFCKSFIPRRTALVAACLLAFSHYVMVFGKIGYNNLQALFAFSLVLALTAWALRWKQPLVFALLGSAMALCFYVYPAALYVLPLPLLLLLLYYPPITRQAIGHWLVMIVVIAAMVYPLMMQEIYWRTKVEGTLYNRPELVQSIGMVVNHFATNLFYALFSYDYIAEGHYVTTAYVDPLTAVFVPIGYFLLLYQMRRQRFAIFTALGFVFFLFSVGASHDRQTPSTSRMFLMVPWFALFGAWGIMWLEETIKKAGLLTSSKRVLIPLLVIAIAAVNVYQANQISYMRFYNTQSTETVFMAITQNIQKIDPNKPRNIAVIVQGEWGYYGLVEFQNVYPYLAWFHLYQVPLTEPVLPQTSMALLSDPSTIVLVAPYVDPAWQNALDPQLTSLGKEHCEVLVPNLQRRLILYYQPGLPAEICTPH